jgi:transcriptional regulator with XRE-family HTH domain
MQRRSTPMDRQETELLASELACNLGRKLRYLRAMRGWTQIELARRAKMSRAYVGRLERGEVLPRYITLVRLAACLGVTPAELVRTEARADCNGSNEPQ